MFFEEDNTLKKIGIINKNEYNTIKNEKCNKLRYTIMILLPLLFISITYILKNLNYFDELQYIKNDNKKLKNQIQLQKKEIENFKKAIIRIKKEINFKKFYEEHTKNQKLEKEIKILKEFIKKNNKNANYY